MKDTAKGKWIVWVNCLVTLALLASGCGSTHVKITPFRIEAESTLLPEKTPTLTGMIPTQIAITPVFSPAISPTPTRTPSPTPTVTPTLFPTLDTEQARGIIEAFLRDGGNCEKPCLFGIMPGKSTLGEAEERIMHLGLSMKKITDQDRDFYDIGYALDSGLSIGWNLAIENDIVTNITIDITPEEPQAGLPRRWSAFSTETLIKRYGQPSSVSIATDWGPRSYFEINIYFDAVDFIVEYLGYDLFPNKQSLSSVCPLTMPFDHIRIWMGKDPIYPPLEAVSLENATPLTIEEFSKLMTGNPDEACFKVRIGIVP